MPNSAVKPLSADGSVGLPHARVGHRQAPFQKPQPNGWGFVVLGVSPWRVSGRRPGRSSGIYTEKTPDISMFGVFSWAWVSPLFIRGAASRAGPSQARGVRAPSRRCREEPGALTPMRANGAPPPGSPAPGAPAGTSSDTYSETQLRKRLGFVVLGASHGE